MVDPLMDVERLLEPITNAKGEVAAAIDTHIHADHLSGAREIQRITGCPVLMYESSQVKFPIETLTEAHYEMAGLQLKVFHTPGHAPEHICLLVNDTVLLTGDCLLVRDVGRADLGRGDTDLLYDSLFNKLLALDDSVEILPAHVGRKHFVAGDTSSTIGIERRASPALQAKSKSEFHEYMTKGWPPKPPHYELFVKVNSGEVDLNEAQELAKASQGELYLD